MDNIQHELSFGEVVEKYPDVPRFIILKIDTLLRGVTLTDRALERAREAKALFEVDDKPIVGEVLFRDGTIVGGLSYFLQLIGKILRGEKSYTLDVVDDKLVLLDDQELVEECDFTPLPEYYGKRTRRGTSMHKVVYSAPHDCLNINVFGYCHFWKEKRPCKYCSFDACFLREESLNLEDIYEAVSEALKESGRWTGFRLVAGSDPRGTTPYNYEVEQYVRVLETLKRCFDTKQIPVRLVASAFSEEQSVRLAEAGAMAYEPHLEVWDERLFEWVCPGKAKWCGRQYWIDSAIAAVKVFGKGNVCNQYVGGAEMVPPHGFKTMDEALESSLEGAEYFAQHGVTTTSTVLFVGRGSVFYGQKQKPAPLEYYVRLAKGLRDIRRAYGLGVGYNDYRRCGGHPDADLSRLDYHEIYDMSY
ncbi:MAG: radical SAM protein [Candidatus Tectomicrobia bacterium]|uniref:Radical SAM protein n=1 Tax=Tectimicrobiota bacterium TaxID=2528274 RepID=A0A932CNC3_UNCTE|nr:radical SAM protein [Candidatus Tectomicrobia bacterium]